MNNSAKVLQFTKIICQYLNANVSIKNSLSLISRMKSANGKVRRAAEEIERKLCEGSSFSAAISQCENIAFPKIYTSFLEIAQETGNICETMSYLEATENEKKDNKNDLKTICLYPVFVTILTFIFSIVLYRYSSFFTLSADVKKSVFIKSTVFISVSAVACFWFLKRIYLQTKKLNLLNGLSFLVSSGVDIKTSLEISISLAEEKKSLERKILSAIDELERGKNISEAISFLSSKDKYIFEIENTCGNLSRSLKTLLVLENERRNEKLKRIKNLSEPVMILIVSIYILIMAKGLVIPALFNYSGILGG